MKINLYHTRKAAGLTQGELAKKIGVDIKTVGNWERENSYPNAEQIWACAVALGCSPNDILGWVEEKPAQDMFERELIECYRVCTPSKQDSLLEHARDSAGMSKEASENHSYQPKQQAAC